MVDTTQQQCATYSARRRADAPAHRLRSARPDQPPHARGRCTHGAGIGVRIGVVLFTILTLVSPLPPSAGPHLATALQGGMAGHAISRTDLVQGDLNLTMDGRTTGGQTSTGRLNGQGQASYVKAVADFIQQCESGGNPHAVNWHDSQITGHPSKGIFQFQPATFKQYALKYGMIPPDSEITPYYESPVYQRKVAERMIAHGEMYHWKICFGKYKRLKALTEG